MLRTASRYLWPLLAALQLLDIATTAIALNTRSAIEGNKTAAHIMSSYGQPVAYLVKAALISALIFALYRFRHRIWARIVLYIAIALSAAAVLNNTAFLLSSHP